MRLRPHWPEFASSRRRSDGTQYPFGSSAPGHQGSTALAQPQSIGARYNQVGWRLGDRYRLGFVGVNNGTVGRFGGLTTVPLGDFGGLTTVPLASLGDLTTVPIGLRDLDLCRETRLKLGRGSGWERCLYGIGSPGWAIEKIGQEGGRSSGTVKQPPFHGLPVARGVH